MKCGWNGAYSDGQAEEGEMCVTALDELGVNTDDDAAAERDGCRVEIDRDGDGGWDVLVIFCRS